MSDDDLLWFRGDNAFIWQVRGLRFNPLVYALCYYHFAASDKARLLDRLVEDDLFGVHLFDLDNRLVLRDLLDSAGEIAFLQRHLELGPDAATILDIGAGYGRLALRLEQAFGERVRIFATDAFAPSTFVCDYYLRFIRIGHQRIGALNLRLRLLSALPGLRTGIGLSAGRGRRPARRNAVDLAIERSQLLGMPSGGGRMVGRKAGRAQGRAPLHRA